MPERQPYILGSSDAERARLVRQSAARESEAIWLLYRILFQVWRIKPARGDEA
jgi:hypothetical protein